MFRRARKHCMECGDRLGENENGVYCYECLENMIERRRREDRRYSGFDLLTVGALGLLIGIGIGEE